MRRVFARDAYADVPSAEGLVHKAGLGVACGVLSLSLATTAGYLVLRHPSALAEGTPVGSDEDTREEEDQAGFEAVAIRVRERDGGLRECVEAQAVSGNAFLVTLDRPVEIDFKATVACLYGEESDLLAKVAPLWNEGDPTNASVVSFVIPDGAYERAVFVVADADGHEAPIELRQVVVDTTPPTIALEGDWQDVGEARDGVRFFACEQSVSLTIADRELDVMRTLVHGVALEELLRAGEAGCGGDAVRFFGWTQSQDDEGRETFEGKLVLEAGFHTLPLVFAVDAVGWSSAEEPTKPLVGMRGLMVDVRAPQVHAQVNDDPQHCVRVEEGDVLAFSGPVELALDFEDESGIRHVELDEQSRGRGMTLKTDKGMSTATLLVPDGRLDAHTCVTVLDLAGNVRRWSLCSTGEVIEEGIAVPAANAPVCGPDGTPVCGDGHPWAMIEDGESPTVSIHGIGEGEVVANRRELHLDVCDDRLGYLALLDPDRVLAVLERDGEQVDCIMMGYDDAACDDTSHRYDLCLPVDSVRYGDGSYTLRVVMEDLVGRRATDESRSFVMDTKPPVLDVSIRRGDGGPNIETDSIVACPLVACVSVIDKGLSCDVLNARESPVRIEPVAGKGATQDDVKVGMWTDGAESDERVCEVRLDTDGTYSLRIEGKDLAGNLMGGTSGTTVKSGVYQSPVCTLDATEPEVTCALEPGSQPREYDGTEFFRHVAAYTITVRDRNFDPRATTVSDSEGEDACPAWHLVHTDAGGVGTYETTMVFREEADGGSSKKALRVCAKDLAHNEGVLGPHSFVIDQTAPTIRSASVSVQSVSQGLDEGQQGPVAFFNQAQGVPSLSFDLFDENMLDAAWVDDPSGAYGMHTDALHGKTDGRLVLELGELQGEGAGHDGGLDRNVRLFVQDIAGNVRIWTIDGRGGVVADRATDVRSAPLDGLGMFPLALVYDATPPRVSIEGPDDGKVFKEPQTVRCYVEERNFEYLQRFDAHQVVATISCEGAAGGNKAVVSHLRVGDFTGSGGRYTCERVLRTDGHYTVFAQVEDMSRNTSNRAALREFTIDTTPPTAHLVWNNTDARNGRYFNAPREATIVVREQNFDPTLMSVRTTGEVGAWETHGEEHVCVVRFLDDADATQPHTLSVSGTDLAGNELPQLREEPFVIDTKAPEVKLKRCVADQDIFRASSAEESLQDGSAFSGAMMPVVEFADEANLDAKSLSVTLEGKRHTPSDSVMHKRMTDSNCGRVWWDNLGYVDEEGAQCYKLADDDIYTLSAEVKDLAGNTSGVVSATFSLNRYGSNFFVEPLAAGAQDEPSGFGELLTKPPQIVVHEVNVSGLACAPGTDGVPEDSLVTKEHAHATSQINRTKTPQQTGYVLERAERTSEFNPYEGWSEYVYVIAAGNFGKGSDSDLGDGGQGAYRVDVSSQDLAHNQNTTARYWDSDPNRGQHGRATSGESGEATAKDASVFFSLDECGPCIEELDVPASIKVCASYEASFFLADEITEGDEVQVFVNGQKTEVWREGSGEVLAEGEKVQQGRLCFRIDSRPAFFAQDVEIVVRDYTGIASRVQTVRVGGIRVTSLVFEAALLVVTIVLAYGLAVAGSNAGRKLARRGKRKGRVPLA